MPIIRKATFGFARLWNRHKIRKQKNRPNLPCGKPWILYHQPADGVLNYAHIPDEELLETLKKSVAEYGKSHEQLSQDAIKR